MEVFHAAKRILATYGQERFDSPRRAYSEGALTIARTGFNELEITWERQIVFRLHASGTRSPHDTFAPGEWMTEVHRIAQSIPHAEQRGKVR